MPMQFFRSRISFLLQLAIVSSTSFLSLQRQTVLLYGRVWCAVKHKEFREASRSSSSRDLDKSPTHLLQIMMIRDDGAVTSQCNEGSKQRYFLPACILNSFNKVSFARKGRITLFAIHKLYFCTRKQDMSGFRGKEIVDAHVRKYCFSFQVLEFNMIGSS